MKRVMIVIRGERSPYNIILTKEAAGLQHLPSGKI